MFGGRLFWTLHVAILASAICLLNRCGTDTHSLLTEYWYMYIFAKGSPVPFAEKRDKGSAYEILADLSNETRGALATATHRYAPCPGQCLPFGRCSGWL